MLDTETEAALAAGIKLFNAGKFFEAHEVWEDAWRDEVGEVKARLQGLIKIAAGFYKAERGVPAGALKLLSAGVAQLAPFRATAWAGVDLDALLCAVEACLAQSDFRVAPRIVRLSGASV